MLLIFGFKQLVVLQCSTRKKSYIQREKNILLVLLFYEQPRNCFLMFDNMSSWKISARIIFSVISKWSAVQEYPISGGISQHGIQLQKVDFVNLLPFQLSLASLCDLTLRSLPVLRYSILAHFKMVKISRIYEYKNHKFYMRYCGLEQRKMVLQDNTWFNNTTVNGSDVYFYQWS